MVKSPPNIQKNTFNILRNTGIFPDIFRMFCIFQYYPEKHDCIFRNIRLYISVWDSIFQNIRIFRNILPEISEYSGIYCQYFSGYFLKIQYYTAVYSGIFRDFYVYFWFCQPDFFSRFHNLGPYFSEFF